MQPSRGCIVKKRHARANSAEECAEESEAFGGKPRRLRSNRAHERSEVAARSRLRDASETALSAQSERLGRNHAHVREERRRRHTPGGPITHGLVLAVGKVCGKGGQEYGIARQAGKSRRSGGRVGGYAAYDLFAFQDGQ